MTTRTETYMEAANRLDSRMVKMGQTRPEHFMCYIDPTSYFDDLLVKKLRAECKEKNKQEPEVKLTSWGSKYITKEYVYIAWRLPKGAKRETYNGYYISGSMPNFKKDDAVIGLLYKRKRITYID